MKPLLKLPLLVLGMSVLFGQAACSAFYSDDRPEVQYQRAQSAEELEVPPDLAAPDKSGEFVVSGIDSSKIQRNTLLPEIEEVRFMREGDLSWLALSVEVEKLWPQVREFIFREGYVLSKNEPLSGYMETTWAEDKIAVPQSGISGFFSDALAVLTPSSSLTSYVFRFERDSDMSTRLFVTHREISEQAIETANPREEDGEYEWKDVGRNPELEARLLTRLMVYLGIDVQRAKGVLSDVEVVQLESPAYIVKNDQQESALFIAEPFALAWPKVSVVLENLNFYIEDEDINTARYQVSYAGAFHLVEASQEDEGFFGRVFGFFDSSDNIKGYQVYLNEQSNGTYVTLSDANGEALHPEEEHAILDAMRLQLI